MYIKTHKHNYFVTRWSTVRRRNSRLPAQRLSAHLTRKKAENRLTFGLASTLWRHRTTTEWMRLFDVMSFFRRSGQWRHWWIVQMLTWQSICHFASKAKYRPILIRSIRSMQSLASNVTITFGNLMCPLNLVGLNFILSCNLCLFLCRVFLNITVSAALSVQQTFIFPSLTWLTQTQNIDCISSLKTWMSLLPPLLLFFSYSMDMWIVNVLNMWHGANVIHPGGNVKLQAPTMAHDFQTVNARVPLLLPVSQCTGCCLSPF